MVTQLDVSEFAAGCFLLLAAFFKSLEAVTLDYLENQGAYWFQLQIVATFTNWTAILLYWFITTYYRYRYNESIGIEQLSLSRDDDYIPIKPINNVSNGANVSYKTHLFAIFPNITYEENREEYIRLWFYLILRGFTGKLAWVFYTIALLYLKSGDFILIQTVVVSIGGIFAGISLFNERMTSYIFISLVLCVLGVILVAQPTFIFGDSHETDTVSALGVLFAVLAGSVRVVASATIKQLKKEFDVHWLALSVVSTVVAAIVSIIVSFCAILWVIVVEGNSDPENWWWNWFNSNDYSDAKIASFTVLLLMTGLIVFGWIITYTIAFQFGNVNRLSLITNTDVIMTYLLSLVIVDSRDNYVAFIGVGVVLIACAILFSEQWSKQQQEHQPQQTEQFEADTGIGIVSGDRSRAEDVETGARGRAGAAGSQIVNSTNTESAILETMYKEDDEEEVQQLLYVSESSGSSHGN